MQIKTDVYFGLILLCLFDPKAEFCLLGMLDLLHSLRSHLKFLDINYAFLTFKWTKKMNWIFAVLTSYKLTQQ